MVAVFAGIAVLVVLCGGVGGVLLVFRGKNVPVLPMLLGPSAAREGEEWTYRDLRDHLERQQLNFRILRSDGRVYFIDAADRDEDHRITYTGYMDRWHALPGVWVLQCDTAREAKDKAGERVEGAHAWGRFYFRGSEPILAPIRTALR